MRPGDSKSTATHLFKPPSSCSKPSPSSTSTANNNSDSPPTFSSFSFTTTATATTTHFKATPPTHQVPPTLSAATEVQPMALSPVEAYEIFSSPRFESFYSTTVEPYLLSTSMAAAGGLFPYATPSLGLFSEPSMSLPTVVTSASNYSLYPFSFAPSPAPLLESHYYDFKGGAGRLTGVLEEFDEFEKELSSFDSSACSSASAPTIASSSSSFPSSARPVLSESALGWYSSNSEQTTRTPLQHPSTSFIPPSKASASLHPQPTYGSHGGVVTLRTPSPNPLMTANPSPSSSTTASNPTSRMSGSPSTSSRTPEQRSLFQPEERKRSAPPYLLLGRGSPASNTSPCDTPKSSSSTSPSPAASPSSTSVSSATPSPPPTTTTPSSSTETLAESPVTERKINLIFANPKKRKSRSKDPNSKRARRLIWTEELQCLFLEAIEFLGGEEATPTSILLYMKVPGLTRENISSHLQKHRQKNTASTPPAGSSVNSPTPALPAEENASS